MSTEIVKRNRSLLEGPTFKEQLKKVLPSVLTPDRFVRVVLTAGMKNPKILECTDASLFMSLLNCASMGLEPNGRHGHIIPYMNNKTGCLEAQFQADYKGLVELAMRSGQISNIHADVVCENDVFEYNIGQVNKHTFSLKDERGPMIGAYCVVTFKDGSKKSDVMSKAEIEAVRRRSKAANSGPWISDYNEMAKKTVFKRVSKWIPLSPEARDTVEEDGPASGTVVEALKNVTGKAPGDLEFSTADVAPEPERVDVEVVTEAKPEPAAEAPKQTPQSKLAEIITGAKFTFDQFRAVVAANGLSKNSDSWGSFDEVPTAEAERFVKARSGLLNMLNAGGAK